MAVDLALAALAGFLAGMLPSATLVSRSMGLPDPRTYGSGNPGATNVMRTGNRLAGRLVFALDLLKGLLPALACAQAVETEGAAAVAGFFSVMGHVWNPLLRMRGGKGVATGLGALVAVDWRVFLAAGAVWLALYLATRTVSLASVSGFVVAMLAAAWLHEFGSLTAACVAGMAMVITVRHRRNLKDLSQGTERTFAPGAGGKERGGKEEKEEAKDGGAGPRDGA